MQNNTNTKKNRYNGGIRGIRIALEQSIQEEREKEKISFNNHSNYYTEAMDRTYVDPYTHAGVRLGREKGADPIRELTTGFYQLLYVLGVPNC